MPPQEKWRQIFHSQGPQLRDRVYVRNPVTAAELASAFVPEGQRDRVVVEAFPGTLCLFVSAHNADTFEHEGPGALTRALLELPKERIRKIIVLEDQPVFHDYLQV